LDRTSSLSLSPSLCLPPSLPIPPSLYLFLSLYLFSLSLLSLYLSPTPIERKVEKKLSNTAFKEISKIRGTSLA